MDPSSFSRKTASEMTPNFQESSTPSVSSSLMAATDSEHVTVKVRSIDGEEVTFKIKRTTQLKKLMDAYVQRVSLNRNQVRFVFDGARIGDDDTAEKLELENGDVIDALVEQTGGSGVTYLLASPPLFQ